jgi:hypothetical protein
MRRRLSAAELERLHQALEQDEIEITSLHALAWRYGWLLPPLHFLPLRLKSPAHLLVAIALPLVGLLPELAATTFAVTVAVALIWVFDSPQTRRAISPHKRSLVIAAIAGVVFLGWYRWAPPQLWPAAAHWLNLLYACALVIGFTIIPDIVAYYRQGKRRERRRWQNYVERTVSIEAF